MQVSNKLWDIFAVNNRKINHLSAELNLICSNSILAINVGWFPLYKITYFKDVVVLFDDICEVNRKDLKKYYIDVRVCKGKIYYRKFTDLFREIVNELIKGKNGIRKLQIIVQNKNLLTIYISA